MMGSFENPAPDLIRGYAAQRIAGELAPHTPDGLISDPVLIQIGKRLVGLRERLEDALMRITNSVNRAAGVEPQGSETASGPAPSNGFLDDIRIELASVDDLVQALAGQADRLERIA